MKTSAMTVEGKKGWANITRLVVGGKTFIPIHGHGATGMFEFNADPRDPRNQEHVAAHLQRLLDGHKGTNGDVAEYLRAVQTFTD